MMIGIGTPSIHSKIERMCRLPLPVSARLA